ncbi:MULTISPECIES: hypothetical protein [unclassified Nocardiopsis]|uniref:hypothetical protein n=1 Tax=unclassified Nocardiopsis TaxID=2649073 RepID=UPI0019156829|nr:MULTISPECIES: hypothetical protein [unclassified Nocardiopsis]
MSVVVLLGVGAIIGLVALTAVVIVTLLVEGPEPTGEDSAPDASEPGRGASRNGSVV